MIKEIDDGGSGGGTSILIRFSENSAFFNGMMMRQLTQKSLKTFDLRKSEKPSKRFIAEQQLLSYRFYAW